MAESDLVCFVVAGTSLRWGAPASGSRRSSFCSSHCAKVVLLLNRANSKVHLKPDDIERFLKMKVDIALPSDAAVPQSVNQGVPALLEYPRSQYAPTRSTSWPGSAPARSEEASSSAAVAKR